MYAVKYLPEQYHLQKTLDLSNSRAAIWMNLAAIPLLFLFGWLFTRLVTFIRPYNPSGSGFLNFFSAFSVWELGAFLLSIIFLLILHELVHGLFFWLFTRARPKFALKSGYAFAANPEWYMPSFQYVMVGLSPFVIISTVSIFLTRYVAFSWVSYLLVIATFNAAGSLGDLIVVGWVIFQPKTILVKDEGDFFSIYGPVVE